LSLDSFRSKLYKSRICSKNSQVQVTNYFWDCHYNQSLLLSLLSFDAFLIYLTCMTKYFSYILVNFHKSRWQSIFGISIVYHCISNHLCFMHPFMLIPIWQCMFAGQAPSPSPRPFRPRPVRIVLLVHIFHPSTKSITLYCSNHQIQSLSYSLITFIKCMSFINAFLLTVTKYFWPIAGQIFPSPGWQSIFGGHYNRHHFFPLSTAQTASVVMQL
jgi:hypothetical protein